MTFLPRLLRPLALALLPVLFHGPVLAAQNPDPTWPCIQRKVPTLSLGQVWNGPELPPSAAQWAKDPSISELVREAAARRLPVDQAEEAILSFARAQTGGQRNERLAMLAQGLFDHMNAERADVIAGIARYAQNQLAMAARLREEGAKFAKLRADPNANANEIITRTEQLALETRIFEERVQSLSFVCEVPTMIEQRLYSLAKSIAKTMAAP